MPDKSALQAGKLRHRIQLADPALSQDSTGGVDPTQGGPYATVWASVEADSGRLRQIFSAQQVVGENYFVVTIRWVDDVRSRHLVYWESRTFQILQVENPDGRHKLLRLLCVERDQSARFPGLSVQ